MKMSSGRFKKLEMNQEYNLKELKFKTIIAEHTEDSVGLYLK